MFGSIFKRRGEGRKGSKIPHKLIYCHPLPLKFEFFEGQGRERDMSNAVLIILI